MAGVILLAGAWHSSWCWHKVTPALEAQGHDVLAPELPGMGEDPTPHRQLTLDKWARFALFEASRFPEPPVLVAHCRAGAIASRAAELEPYAFASILYVAGFMLPRGTSILDPQNYRQALSPTGPINLMDGEASITMDPDFALKTLYHLTPEAEARDAAARLEPEPLAPMLEELDITDENYGRVRRGYVQCVQDRAINLARQQQMCAMQPCAVLRINCDHAPFLSRPSQLANLIDEWAAEDAA